MGDTNQKTYIGDLADWLDRIYIPGSKMSEVAGSLRRQAVLIEELQAENIELKRRLYEVAKLGMT